MQAGVALGSGGARGAGNRPFVPAVRKPNRLILPKHSEKKGERRTRFSPTQRPKEGRSAQSPLPHACLLSRGGRHQRPWVQTKRQNHMLHINGKTNSGTIGKKNHDAAHSGGGMEESDGRTNFDRGSTEVEIRDRTFFKKRGRKIAWRD